MKNKAKKFKGFTLAEVLITLVIIGVVGALTIPGIVVKYQKEQTVVKLKKVYFVLQEAMHKALIDYGPMNTWEYGNSWDGAKLVARKYFYPYLHVIKKCGCDTDETCYFDYEALNKSETYVTNHCVSTRFYINDGTFIYINPTAGNADGSVPIKVMVDINGRKEPNVLGKDVFGFIYYFRDSDSTKKYANKVNPVHIRGANNCTKTSNGNDCTLKIIEDNWQIKDDYPW